MCLLKGSVLCARCIHPLRLFLYGDCLDSVWRMTSLCHFSVILNPLCQGDDADFRFICLFFWGISNYFLITQWNLI